MKKYIIPAGGIALTILAYTFAILESLQCALWLTTTIILALAYGYQRGRTGQLTEMVTTLIDNVKESQKNFGQLAAQNILLYDAIGVDPKITKEIQESIQKTNQITSNEQGTTK